jgi:hypothetical protein|tara:strand:- start:473 stop:643 length:171 start_codon:yes stop_codon:yes gene_type:complete
MIYEIFNTIGMILILCIVGYLVYESSIMVSEKKSRYRAGTHDYYDNPIEEEEITDE